MSGTRSDNRPGNSLYPASPVGYHNKTNRLFAEIICWTDTISLQKQEVAFIDTNQQIGFWYLLLRCDPAGGELSVKKGPSAFQSTSCNAQNDDIDESSIIWRFFAKQPAMFLAQLLRVLWPSVSKKLDITNQMSQQYWTKALLNLDKLLVGRIIITDYDSAVISARISSSTCDALSNWYERTRLEVFADTMSMLICMLDFMACFHRYPQQGAYE